ncbi:MAG: hypothetical protein PHT07_10165 [Paludibacter sp.]|nr:hypothetical protein [Paludibacter sp.]
MIVQSCKSRNYHIVAGQLNPKAKIHCVDMGKLASECGVEFEGRDFVCDEVGSMEDLRAIINDHNVCKYCRGLFNHYAIDWNIDFTAERI